MRFLLPDPLGNDKHSQMFHTSGFAIAAGVVAVGAAAGSAAISMSASDRAKKAQGAASGSFQKQINAATNTFTQQQDQVKAAIAAISPKIKVPDYSLLGTPDIFEKDRKGNIKKDKKGNPIIKEKGSPSATLEAIQAANLITSNTIRQLENIDPGSTDAFQQVRSEINNWKNNLGQQYQNLQANQQLIDQQRQAVSAMIAGRTTPQQDQEFNRKLAEGTGAAFNMQTARLGLGGFQTAQATYADQLMQSGERRMLAGLQLAPGVNEQQRGLAASSISLSEGFRGLLGSQEDWTRLAGDFVQGVPQIMGIGLQGQQLNVQKKQYEFQNALAQQTAIAEINNQQFGARSGQAGSIYGARTQNAAASYAAQQAVGQGVSDIGQAVSGALSGYGSALAKKNAVGGGGYGGYASMGQAQQAAPYAGGFSQVYGSGYVPRATAV
jgi:hypothetical protein